MDKTDATETLVEKSLDPIEDGGDVKGVTPAPNEILRVEGTVAARWSGVRLCCEQAQAQFNEAFKNWKEEQKRVHPTMTYLRAGAAPGTAYCTDSNSGFPEYRNSCTGHFSIAAWIEFYKNG